LGGVDKLALIREGDIRFSDIEAASKKLSAWAYADHT
jgi:hypothetical protein